MVDLHANKFFLFSFFQVPYYQGELITFDVVPSKLTFSVNYKSVVLKVKT